MDLETFIVAVFCLADDFVRDLCGRVRLRQRGPAPVLADSEVLAIEAAGEFLGLDTDQALHAYFRRHFAHLFPGLRVVHRTTLARQAANLWLVKVALWQHLAAATRHDAALTLVDSLPVPVCRFARAQRCRGFRGLAAFGHDALAHQTYYGLRLHLRVAWPGVVTAATLAPANDADRAVAPQLLVGLEGWALGDGGYWSPSLRAELAAGGLDLIAPARGKAAEAARWPAWLVQTRRRIETVLSQLTGRYNAKQIRARDPWHLAARWARKFVSHTVAVLFCQRAGLSPLAFAQLVRVGNPHTGLAPPPQQQASMPDIPLTLPSAAQPVPRRPRTGLPRQAYGVASVAAMLLLWWAISGGRVISADLLPSPSQVWAAALGILHDGYRGTTLWGNALSTLGRLGGGFGLAVLTGVPLGLWMGRNRYVGAGVDWIIQFLRPLPPLSYMILLILWLGTGDASKTALLFLTAFPIIVAASAAGVSGVQRQRIQAAEALGATRSQVFRHVVLPSAAPMILTGLQIALAAAFSTVVSAELMAATDGLGWMVISASHFLRNDVIILCILVLGLLGVGLAWALRALDRRLVHWRGRD